MTNSTNQPVTFEDVKREYLSSYDEICARYGRTRQELATDIVSSLLSSIMFGRAARKGNVAKTIFWGIGAINRAAYFRSLREVQERKREREEADKFFRS